MKNLLSEILDTNVKEIPINVGLKLPTLKKLDKKENSLKLPLLKKIEI